MDNNGNLELEIYGTVLLQRNEGEGKVVDQYFLAINYKTARTYVTKYGIAPAFLLNPEKSIKISLKGENNLGKLNDIKEGRVILMINNSKITLDDVKSSKEIKMDMNDLEVKVL